MHALKVLELLFETEFIDSPPPFLQQRDTECNESSQYRFDILKMLFESWKSVDNPRRSSMLEIVIRVYMINASEACSMRYLRKFEGKFKAILSRQQSLRTTRRQVCSTNIVSCARRNSTHPPKLKEIKCPHPKYLGMTTACSIEHHHEKSSRKICKVIAYWGRS